MATPTDPFGRPSFGSSDFTGVPRVTTPRSERTQNNGAYKSERDANRQHVELHG